MRGFRTLAQYFWGVPEIQALSIETRLMALYLMTGPHTTPLGCFYCPKMYVTEDLNLSWDVVKQGFQSLCEKGWLHADPDSGWLLLPHFFQLNPIQNTNQGRSIEKRFQRLPSAVRDVFKQELVDLLQTQAERLPASFKKHLDAQTAQRTQRTVPTREPTLSKGRIPIQQRGSQTFTLTFHTTQEDSNGTV